VPNSHSSWAIPYSSSRHARSDAMSAEEAGIPLMPGHAERVTRAEGLLAAARAPVCRWCSSRRYTGPAEWTSAANWTARRRALRRRPARYRSGAVTSAAVGRFPPGIPHRQAAVFRFHRNGFRDRLARARRLHTDSRRWPDRRVRALHVRRAHQRDFYVRVVTDCVGGSSQARHDASLDAMEYLQTGANRTTDDPRRVRRIDPATNVPSRSRRSHTMTQPPRRRGLAAARRGRSHHPGRSPVRRFGFGRRHAQRGADGQGAAPVVPADPGQPPDPDVYYAGQGLLLTTNTYEGLLQFKGGRTRPSFEPLLATEWTASPDKRCSRSSCAEGVKFHDGTPFKFGRGQGVLRRRQLSTVGRIHGQGYRIRYHTR